MILANTMELYAPRFGIDLFYFLSLILRLPNLTINKL